ncbi:MAG TPA: glycosyltransferase family 2 protein [Bacteroidales bacterium]|nr:glycosyltransferase family 2 protein [Bacteroidales bacterium]
MKFSIVTATYNSEKTVRECIASVNRQTHVDIEHFFIDGRSADSTLMIIRRETHRNTWIISEHDNGIYDALNKGIALAGGDVIGLLHSDDLLASDTVIEEINRVFMQTGADVVYGDLIYFMGHDSDKIFRYWKSRPFDRSLAAKGWMPAHPSVFIRREVFKRYGLFDLQFKIASDYDFMLRIMLAPDLRFEYLPLVITKMRTGGSSNCSVNNIIRKSSEDYRAMRKNGLHHPLRVLRRKNLSKVNQFFIKYDQ